MPFNVSAWSMRRPIAAIVISIIFVVLGAMTFESLPIARLPSVEVPVVSITVTATGGAPADLAGRVTKPVEDEISGLDGVRHVVSSVTDGTSVTLAQFRAATNSDRALNDVKDAIARLKARMPKDIGEPVVQRVDFIALPVVTYAIDAPDKSPEQLSTFVDDVVRPALQRVRGVGQVERAGGVDREVSVSLDPDRLQSLGLTAPTVSRQLRGARGVPAEGRAEIGGLDQSIRMVAPATSMGDIAAFPIALPTGVLIRLDEVATVASTFAEPKTFVRFDGAPIVGFSVRRAKYASDVGVAARIAATIEAIHATHPEVSFRLVETSADFTSDSYKAALQTFLEGIALAILVVLVGLRDVRAAIITAIALVTSITPAFWALHLLGIPLNMVSMLAMTMAVGFIVDDCVVEIDAIKRRMTAETAPLGAAVEPTVLGINLTIVTILLSVSFMGGTAGEIFRQFGVVLAILIGFSTVSSRLLTPALAAAVLTPGRKSRDAAVASGGWAVLLWPLRHYYVTVAAGLVVCGALVFVVPEPPAVFLPAQDLGRSLLAVELPPGTPLSRTADVTETIVRRVRMRPEVRSVFVDGGRLPSAAVAAHVASLTITYVPKADRSLTQRQLEHAIGDDLQTVPDIRYWFLNGNGLRDVAFVVTGQDVGTVGNVAAEFARQIQRLPTVSNVVSSASLDRPELHVRPRLDAAARLGISPEQLADTVRIATIGDVLPAFAKLDESDRQTALRIQFDAGLRGDRDRLSDLRVPLAGGHGTVPLASVADLSFSQGPFKITRYDREIEADVCADLAANAVLGKTMADIETLPIMTSLPRGIKIAPSGDVERFKDLSASLVGVLRYPLLLGGALLILLFRSFLQLLSVLLPLLLSIGALLIILLIARMPLSVPVYMGCLVVIGMFIKHAGTLVNLTTAAIDGGMAREAALIETRRQRALPIVIATLAMVAATLPTAFLSGAGAEFRSPAAVVVIGGAIIAASLAFLFVPAMFLAMDDIGSFGRRLGAKLVRSRAPSVPSDDQKSA